MLFGSDDDGNNKRTGHNRLRTGPGSFSGLRLSGDSASNDTSPRLSNVNSEDSSRSYSLFNESRVISSRDEAIEPSPFGFIGLDSGTRTDITVPGSHSAAASGSANSDLTVGSSLFDSDANSTDSSTGARTDHGTSFTFDGLIPSPIIPASTTVLTTDSNLINKNWVGVQVSTTSCVNSDNHSSSVTVKSNSNHHQKTSSSFSNPAPSTHTSPEDDMSTKLMDVMNQTPRHRKVSNIHGVQTSNRKPMSLNEFLYEQALGEGICSDVIIKAFGKNYNLHKLILHRSPYFATLFSGLWNSSDKNDKTVNDRIGDEDGKCGSEGTHKEELNNSTNSKGLASISNPLSTIAPSKTSESAFTLQFDADPHITKEVFELALSHLYGSGISPKQSKNLFGIFAVASFLDLPDLGDECLNQLVKGINRDNVAEVASFATSFNYGRSSELVSEACKSFLCTEGITLSDEIWRNIPNEMLVEVATSDGLFVRTEWDRCQFLVEHYRYTFTAMSELKVKMKLDIPSKNVEYEAATGHHASNQENEDSVKTDSISSNDQALGRDDEEAPFNYNAVIDDLSDRLLRIQDALNTGIHYAHMTPSQLESLESHRDENGKSLIDRTVLRDGLWKQIMLQQTISRGTNASSSTLGFIENTKFPPSFESDEVFYPVPSEEVKVDSSQSCIGSERTSDVAWSRHPPFRFAVEFPNFTDTEENRRTYSDTFWYAGSFWNVYIQKVARKKGYQLGVYLHRGKPDVPPDAADKVTLFSPHAPEKDLYLGDEDDVSNEDLTTVAMESLSFNEYQPASLSSAGNFSSSRSVSSPFTYPVSARNYSSSGLSIFGSTVNNYKDSDGNDMKKIRHAVNMTPQYIDKRQKVSAYFKIYTTSRTGNPSLTCFSSSPDKFDISQSWGWKSTSLLSSATARKGSLKFMVVVGVI